MKISFLILGLLLSVSVHANAMELIGGVGSGGGKGVLCETAGQRTVESLDLFEAKNVWGYSIPASQNLENEIKRVMPVYWSAHFEEPTQAPFKYDEDSWINFLNIYQHEFIRIMRFIPSGSRLRPTEDATIILDPPSNCKIIQVLVYLDEGTGSSGILVDKEYWDLVDDQNRLALFLHERDYKSVRSYSQIDNTDSIRKYVGATFSSAPYPSPYKNVRKADSVLYCQTQANHPTTDYNPVLFYVIPIEDLPEDGIHPSTQLFFEHFGNFGNKKGPVEYMAFSIFGFEKFAGEVGPGNGGGGEILFADSILGGNRIEIRVRTNCPTGQTDLCPVKITLHKNKSDGSSLDEEVSCKKVTTIK